MTGGEAEAAHMGPVAGTTPAGDYLRWNKILAEYFLLDAEPEKNVVLSVSPTTLARALYAAEGEHLSAEDAQSAFKRAVASMYSEFVIEGRHSISDLGAVGADDLPRSVGFLGLSVLAAYEQERNPERGDEQYGKLPYYPILAESLGVRLAGNNLPVGFQTGAFDALWEGLAYWVMEHRKAVFDLPPRNSGHVVYPLHHVLLRQVDIDKLPNLFEREGFEPWGRSVSANRMGRALDAFPRLTGAARNALGDERRHAVIQQALAALEEWDGAVSVGRGARKAAIRVHLWFRRDTPALSYLPARPAGFPEVFETAIVTLEADDDDSYYGSIPIQFSDGSLLRDGFEWSAKGFTLRRPPSRVFALTQADGMSGFLSEPGLHRGRKSAVLCVEEMRESVGGYLEAVTGRPQRPMSGPDLPEGWVLFAGVVPESVIDPPPGLESLEVSESVSVEFIGGIRLDRGMTWLAGATPSVLVTPGDLSVSVDGQPCALTGGEVVSPLLQELGRHAISVGRVSRRMAVAEASVSDACLALLPDEEQDAVVLALPYGEWTLLGSHPSETAHVACDAPSGVFACHFSPVWAVAARRGGGPQPVLCLVDAPPPPRQAQPSPACRDWCDAIRRAQQNLTRFELLGPIPHSAPSPRPGWNRYVAASKRLRRRCGRER